MRPLLNASIPAAALACLLTAPVALAADSKNTFENQSITTGSSDAAPSAAHSASSGGSIVRTIVGLAVVLGVIYGITWLLRQVKASKENAGDAGENLESIATLTLGTNRSLHLVRVGGEIVLLGAAEHQITPIRRYSESEAHSLGLLEPAPMTLAALESETTELPKGLMNVLRAKTAAVVK